jgi:hypothetical protein
MLKKCSSVILNVVQGLVLTDSIEMLKRVQHDILGHYQTFQHHARI